MEVGTKVRLKLEHYDTWLPLRGTVTRMEDNLVWMKSPRMDGSNVFSQKRFEEYYEVDKANTATQDER